MEKEELQELIEKENKSKTDEFIIINSEEFNNRLIELRNENPESKWSNISKILSNEFKMSVNPKTIENKFIAEASLEIQVDAYAEKQFSKYIGKMAERYERLIRIADKLMKAAELLIDKISDIDETSTIEELVRLVQLIRPLEPLMKTTISQLEFVREEQDKITTTLRKNRKEVSDDDIRAKAQKYVKDILEVYEAQGKIKVYDPRILK
jgi:hypothetical protein